jgi:hypothetical protein
LLHGSAPRFGLPAGGSTIVKLSGADAELLRVLDRVRVRPNPDQPVEVQVMGPAFLEVLHVRDVSEVGLGVFAPRGFDGCELRGAIELIVTLPGAPSFHAAGVMRHVTLDGPLPFFGVELTRVSDPARAALRAYVQKRLAEGAESRIPLPPSQVG